MRVSGFTIIRNGVKFDYPFVESIQSLLPLVDEMIVAVGDGDDDTPDRVQALASPKIRVIDTVWDPSQRRGGWVLAEQTNIALGECTGDWCFYLQADEVLHEEDYGAIRNAMRRHLHNARVEGLWFRYRHFMGDYDILNRLGYRREVRIVRNRAGIRSVGDASGFARRDGGPLRARELSPTRSARAFVYHYGWVRPPRALGLKSATFFRFYDEGALGDHPSDDQVQDWIHDLRGCVPYRGSHPAVMNERIAAKDWPRPDFQPVPLWRNAYWWRVRLRKAGLLPGRSRAANPA